MKDENETIEILLAEKEQDQVKIRAIEALGYEWEWLRSIDDMGRQEGTWVLKDKETSAVSDGLNSMDNNNDIIHRLRTHTPASCSTLVEDAIKEIENLREQRDQARIEYCIAEAENDMHNHVVISPTQIAEECGWHYLVEKFDEQDT